MSLPRQHITYSVEEYLAIDRASDERYEYLDGFIFAMAGETPAHGDICTNITWSLHGQLRQGPCHVFSKDTKVRSGPEPRPGRKKGLFSYPDVVVVCGRMEFHDDHQDVLLNPTLIIEVTSPNTAEFDRGDKWLGYQTWLPTLTDYLMVSQATLQVEHYSRVLGGEWVYRLANIEEIMRLESINCTLAFSDIYDRVVFSTLESEPCEQDFPTIGNHNQIS